MQIIVESGRMAWQEPSGYRRRALVTDVSRFKRIIGDGLRFRTDRRRATEVAIAAGALDRMLELPRPDYIRIAQCSVKMPGCSRLMTRATHSLSSVGPSGSDLTLMASVRALEGASA